MLSSIRNLYPRSCAWSTTSVTVCGASRRGIAIRKKAKYWSAEKLKAVDEYPLSLRLQNSLEPRIDKEFGTSYDTPYIRPQIVSPDLCDDVLKYIGPTIEKYKGYDILDLNPGAGLWSSKLHDFLQPRTHVLLESEPDRFKEYLDPLVQKPDSTYKLVQGDPRRFDSLKTFAWEGHFPHQTPMNPDDPRAQVPNDTLLVTGTLIWDPKLRGLGFDSMVKQLLAIYGDAWRNRFFHVYGPTRMLFWTPNEEFKTLLPQHISGHQKSSFFMQQTAEVQELVSPSHSDVKTRHGLREPRYMFEDLARAAKRTEENGFEYPAHRREDLHDFVDEVLEKTDRTGIMTASDCYKFLEDKALSGKCVDGLGTDLQLQYWRETRAMNQNAHSKAPEEEPKERQMEGEENEKKQTKTKTRKPKLGPAEKKFGRLRSQMVAIAKVATERDHLVELGDQIYQFECKILDMQDGMEKDAALKELDAMQKEFDDGISMTAVNWRPAVLADLDDRLSIRSPVPRLMWDMRPLQPLVMRSREAWPFTGCSLVDITPRPQPSSLVGEQADYTYDFAIGLLQRMPDNVLEALENMQPGASEIANDIESLRDPKKGGRLRLENLRVRMLTVEHVQELSIRYREWPFRTPDAEHPRYFQLRNVKGSGARTWDGP